MTLSAVIPVRNDARRLKTLVAQLAASGIFARVIVVDDGSRWPLRAGALRPPDMNRDWLRVIRLWRSRGPGVARNLGLGEVATSHLIFLDSDDRITAELPAIWAAIEARDFDFCLFRHADSRLADLGLWGQPALDESQWLAAGLPPQAPRPVARTPEGWAEPDPVPAAPPVEVGPAAAAELARVAAYPWNKIYRAAFLRDHGIRCTPIRFHEDIELHWQSFLHARRILAAPQAGVLHFVGRPGQMTLRRSRDRLRALPAIEALTAIIPLNSLLYLPWVSWVSQLFDWIDGQIDAADRPGFHDWRRGFLARVPPAVFAELARREPRAALRLNRQLGP